MNMETNKLADVISTWISGLEARIKQLEEQLANMREANNQLADIAFDENRFTQQLLEKVDDTAREAVKESLDYDEIALEMSHRTDDFIDLDSLSERVVNSADLVSEDKVRDLIERYLIDNNFLNAHEIDEAIGDYIERNWEEIAQQTIETIANRLGQTPPAVPSSGASMTVQFSQTSLQEGGSQ